MTDLIRALARWARPLFRSPGGWPPGPAALRHERPPLPAPRSPYGLDTPLDGGETALVRPYLRAHEQRHRQLALVLAADFGIDVGAHVVGGQGAV